MSMLGLRPNVWLKSAQQLTSTRIHTFKRCKSGATLYDVLGIKIDASQQEIKQAYFERSKSIHPDRCKCAGDLDELLEVRERSEAFIRLKSAYDTLRDAPRRQHYDACLAHGKQDYWCEYGTEPADNGRSYYWSMNTIMDDFWSNFGIFGFFLRYLTRAIVLASMLLPIFLYFCEPSWRQQKDDWNKMSDQSKDARSTYRPRDG